MKGAHDRYANIEVSSLLQAMEDQQLKPSLNYVVTLAFDLEAPVLDTNMDHAVTTVAVGAANKEEQP